MILAALLVYNLHSHEQTPWILSVISPIIVPLYYTSVNYTKIFICRLSYERSVKGNQIKSGQVHLGNCRYENCFFRSTGALPSERRIWYTTKHSLQRFMSHCLHCSRVITSQPDFVLTFWCWQRAHLFCFRPSTETHLWSAYCRGSILSRTRGPKSRKLFQKWTSDIKIYPV